MRQEVEKFKSRYINLPIFKDLISKGKELNDDQWTHLHDRVKALGIKKLQASRLIQLLSEVLDTNFSTVNAGLQRKNTDRACKRIVSDDEPAPSTKKRAMEREYKDTEANQDPQRQLIMDVIDANNITPLKKKKLEKYNVRITSLTESSPVKGYEGVPTVRTPGKSTAYQVYAAETTIEDISGKISERRYKFFKKTTPEKNKLNPGRARIKDLSIEEIREEIPQLVSKKIPPQEYTVKFQDILKAHVKKRRFGQNSLTGASCREVFAAYGADTIIKPKGSDYHWSHIRGLCLGGQHSADHLFPATAASNYSTLLVVENFIIEKLSEEREFPIEQINIKVTPVYSQNSEILIPEVINFELTWEELNSDLEVVSKKEIITISTRSELKLTQGARAAINSMRVGASDEVETKEQLTEIPRRHQ
ncbi:DNA/RNA non-specific endonuclease [Legionella gresilensis]|uniref:DNA/RNA non-specific endonuclease n=1 Tax=Legionella gresilensis TaxID=91823 RepID=UPI001040E3E1|nr:DNA/RNA non-specific endonuclease [Legionella gresilensis]